MVRRGSTGDSGSDTTYSGGGSDTDTGSGVTGDDGDDTSYGGGGGSSTDSPSGSTGSDDSSDDSGGSYGGGDTGGGSYGGSDDDDDNDSGVVGGGGSRAGDDSDTTYSGGGSSTDAPSGSTGDDGTDTTYSGGGGDQTTTQAPEGETGTEDPTKSDDPSTQEQVDRRLDGDADRGVSVTRQTNPLDGGQLEQSEDVQETAREGRSEDLSGLEEEYGALSGKEGGLASQVQQLQARIDRETSLDAYSDRDAYAIRRRDGQLVAEFADSATQRGQTERSPTQRRQAIAEEIADDRSGIEPDDVIVTQTADGYQASIRSNNGTQAVITGGPERERIETNVRTGETEDRGVGITVGPAGSEVVYPEGGRQPRRGQPANSRDVSWWTQGQRSSGAGNRARSRAGTETTDRAPLIESDAGLVEALGDPATRRRRRLSIFNDALAAAGLEDELGFREQTAETTEPNPAESRGPFQYLRGSGPQRRTTVERDVLGRPIRETLRADKTRAAALIGVGSPEPISTTAGGIVLGTAGAVALSGTVSDKGRSNFLRSGSELDVPEEQQRSELETPEEQQQRELEAPEQRPGQRSELDAPNRPVSRPRSELETPTPSEPAPMTIRTAQLRGRQEARQRDEEGNDPLRDDVVPDRFIPDEEMMIGGETDTTEPQVGEGSEFTEEIQEPTVEQGQERLYQRQQESQSVSQEQTEPELDQQTQQLLDETAQSTATSSGATEPLFRPGIGIRDRARGRARSVTEPVVGTIPLQDFTQAPAQKQALDQQIQQQQRQTAEQAVEQQISEQVANSTEPVEIQEPAVGRPGTGCSVSRRRKRPRGADRTAMTTDTTPGVSTDIGTGGTDDLAPSWIGQTYATIATGGRVDEPVPSTEVLAERPATERATGALPTGLELYGSAEEQEQFAEVSAFFSFGDSGGFNL